MRVEGSCLLKDLEIGPVNSLSQSLAALVAVYVILRGNSDHQVASTKPVLVQYATVCTQWYRRCLVFSGPTFADRFRMLQWIDANVVKTIIYLEQLPQPESWIFFSKTVRTFVGGHCCWDFTGIYLRALSTTHKLPSCKADLPHTFSVWMPVLVWTVPLKPV